MTPLNRWLWPGGMRKSMIPWTNHCFNRRIHVLDPDFKWLAYVSIPKSCGKFSPMPDMLAVTTAGDLLLANTEGWVKILKLSF